jgi:alkaline phosphatase
VVADARRGHPLPDSAATGTDWATGKKTIDERVSQGPSSAVDVPGDNDAHETVLEIAQEQGKKTGNVSTAEITDATPAVLAAHTSDRGCQGPEDTAKTCPTETKAAGGLGSIAEQEVDHGIDVILGGGAARFAQKTDAGPTVLDEAVDAGYEIVKDAAGLAAFSDDDTPLLGLFTNGNMTTEWAGPIATLGAGNDPAVRCKTDNRPATEPSLAAMTRKAISQITAEDATGPASRPATRRTSSRATARACGSPTAPRATAARASRP